MKLNWGTGIAIFYACFVIVMVSMVIKSSQNNVQLVQENYYDHDLDYENFRQKRQNAKTMQTPVKVEYLKNAKNLLLTFPPDMPQISGEVALFRPSNKLMDQRYTLQINNKGQMEVPLNNKVSQGFWKVKIDWQSNGKNYYKEENIIL